MDPVAVALARADIRQVRVPAVAVDLRQLDPLLAAARGVVAVQQAQLDALGDAAEEREVGPGAVVGGAQRVGPADPLAGRRRDRRRGGRRSGAGLRWHRRILAADRVAETATALSTSRERPAHAADSGPGPMASGAARSTEVVVLGLGGMGSAAAAHLARRGRARARRRAVRAGPRPRLVARRDPHRPPGVLRAPRLRAAGPAGLRVVGRPRGGGRSAAAAPHRRPHARARPTPRSSPGRCASATRWSLPTSGSSGPRWRSATRSSASPRARRRCSRPSPAGSDPRTPCAAHLAVAAAHGADLRFETVDRGWDADRRRRRGRGRRRAVTGRPRSCWRPARGPARSSGRSCRCARCGGSSATSSPVASGPPSARAGSRCTCSTSVAATPSTASPRPIPGRGAKVGFHYRGPDVDPDAIDRTRQRRRRSTSCEPCSPSASPTSPGAASTRRCACTR